MRPGALDNEAFTEEFNAVITRRGMSTEQVAQRLAIPSEMVERWKSGISGPHPGLREMVLHDLENCAIP